MCVQILVHAHKYIEHLSNNNKHEEMHENAYIQAVAINFYKRREEELSISRTFVRLNVLDYKAIISSVVIEAVLWQVACEQRVAVVSRITNSCVEQPLSVIISVVSVNCEQWHKSRERTIKSLTETEHICFYLVCN